MEWTNPINNILKQEITRLDHTLVPSDYKPDKQNIRYIQEYLFAIIDHLGEMSATAQGLSKAITSGVKMQSNTNFILYLLKDATANNGRGSAIGLLKVGYKHLYLADPNGKMHEVEPLCILDFYVKKDYQRRGVGKKLFNFMLKDMNTQPQYLAIDGPSAVMLMFLEKCYNMKGMVRQANNFAVVPNFFEDIDKISTSACSTPSSTASGAGRFTAPKPQSAIGKIIHGQSAETHSMLLVDGPAPEELPRALPSELPRALPSPVETEAGDMTPPTEELSAAATEAVAQRPCTLYVETPPALDASAPSPVASTASRRDSQLTEKGFFDVKFYHNKLW